jgi:hypothetical protein
MFDADLLPDMNPWLVDRIMVRKDPADDSILHLSGITMGSINELSAHWTPERAQALRFNKRSIGEPCLALVCATLPPHLPPPYFTDLV